MVVIHLVHLSVKLQENLKKPPSTESVFWVALYYFPRSNRKSVATRHPVPDVLGNGLWVDMCVAEVLIKASDQTATAAEGVTEGVIEEVPYKAHMISPRVSLTASQRPSAISRTGSCKDPRFNISTVCRICSTLLTPIMIPSSSPKAEWCAIQQIATSTGDTVRL